MPVRESDDVFTASANELRGAPLVHAWCATKCNSVACEIVHLFLFGEGDELIGQIPLDEEAALELITDIYKALGNGRGVN